jgi:hypothetical protein
MYRQDLTLSDAADTSPFLGIYLKVGSYYSRGGGLGLEVITGARLPVTYKRDSLILDAHQNGDL